MDRAAVALAMGIALAGCASKPVRSPKAALESACNGRPPVDFEAESFVVGTEPEWGNFDEIYRTG